MSHKPFEPFHIGANADDLAGNNGLGRYILLPGSDARARQLAEHFDNSHTCEHHRGHHLYVGTLTHQNITIDVASIATGMGCPSAEIIMHELLQLGGRRFLRVGTAGSLQSTIALGDFVNVQAAVRDESTTLDYAPAGFPAVASPAVIQAVNMAAEQLHLTSKLHTGLAHCKSSFYAREFGVGPRAERNNAYMKFLTDAGVLATEMETSTLFMQAQLHQPQALCGAILAILAIPPHKLATADEHSVITPELIKLALETIKTLAVSEQTTG